MKFTNLRRITKTLGLLLVLGGLTAGCGGNNNSPLNSVGITTFPVGINTKWEYSDSAEHTRFEIVSGNVTQTVLSQTTQNGSTSWRIASTNTIQNLTSIQIETEEVTPSGNYSDTITYQLGPEGLYFLDESDPQNINATLIAPLPLSVGMSWTYVQGGREYNAQAIRTETLDLPAGQFETIEIVYTPKVPAKLIEFRIWLSNEGIVKNTSIYEIPFIGIPSQDYLERSVNQSSLSSFSTD